MDRKKRGGPQAGAAPRGTHPSAYRGHEPEAESEPTFDPGPAARGQMQPHEQQSACSSSPQSSGEDGPDPANRPPAKPPRSSPRASSSAAARASQARRIPKTPVWTLEEDLQLRELSADVLQGAKTWSVVAQAIGTKTPAQCRARYHWHLKEDAIKNRPWTEEEKRLVGESYKKLGPSWTEIARRLDGRSSHAVKACWTTLVKGAAKARSERMMGKEVSTPMWQADLTSRPRGSAGHSADCRCPFHPRGRGAGDGEPPAPPLPPANPLPLPSSSSSSLAPPSEPKAKGKERKGRRPRPSRSKRRREGEGESDESYRPPAAPPLPPPMHVHEPPQPRAPSPVEPHQPHAQPPPMRELQSLPPLQPPPYAYPPYPHEPVQLQLQGPHASSSMANARPPGPGSGSSPPPAPWLSPYFPPSSPYPLPAYEGYRPEPELAGYAYGLYAYPPAPVPVPPFAPLASLLPPTPGGPLYGDALAAGAEGGAGGLPSLRTALGLAQQQQQQQQQQHAQQHDELLRVAATAAAAAVSAAGAAAVRAAGQPRHQPAQYAQQPAFAWAYAAGAPGSSQRPTGGGGDGGPLPGGSGHGRQHQ